MINSYPSIYNLGHRLVKDLLLGPVVVQEKIDGSQFSFGLVNGELKARSKGKQIDMDNPDKLFGLAVEVVKSLEPLLVDGAIYRGEYLQKPKHNTLAYGRVPERYIMLYDVEFGEQNFSKPETLAAEGRQLGLETVPLIHYGPITSVLDIEQMLERESVLGNVKIEGVVIKNYEQFGLDGKVLMGKYVSEAFKEKHRGDWKNRNPTSTDIVQRLIETYRTEARRNKAVQHLRESGLLTNSPKDIGLLVKEVPADILSDSEEEIKQALFEYFWPKISKGINSGVAEWYKERLLREQFA